MLEVDATNQVIFAMWFWPMLAGAQAGLWLAPEIRGTKQSVQLVCTVLDCALQNRPLVLGVTKQENLLEPHRKLGYTVSERLPSFWDGEDAWVVTVTRPAFQQSLTYRIWQRSLHGKVANLA